MDVDSAFSEEEYINVLKQDLKTISKAIPDVQTYNMCANFFQYTPLFLIVSRHVQAERLYNTDSKLYSKELKICPKIVHYFIELGIDLNIPNLSNGLTPIHACVKGSEGTYDLTYDLIISGLSVPMNIFIVTDHIIDKDISELLNASIKRTQLLAFSAVTVQNVSMVVREVYYTILSYTESIEHLKSLGSSKINFTVKKLESEIQRLREFIKANNLEKEYHDYEKIVGLKQRKIIKRIGKFL
jgi:hypothetical protein